MIHSLCEFYATDVTAVLPGVSEMTFHCWRKKLSGTGMAKLGRLQHPEEESHALLSLIRVVNGGSISLSPGLNLQCFNFSEVSATDFTAFAVKPGAQLGLSSREIQLKQDTFTARLNRCFLC